MRLSLWLRPPGKAREVILETMRRLRERLAQSIKPVTLKLGRIDWRTLAARPMVAR